MKSDKISSIIVVFFAALVLFETRKYPLGTVDNPGPGFLPMILGIAIGLMSTVLLIRVWNREKAGTENTSWPDKTGLLKVSLIFLSIVLFTTFLEITGYIINTFVLFLSLLRFVGRQRWSLALSISIGATLISYLLFDRWLIIPLPRGIIKL